MSDKMRSRTEMVTTTFVDSEEDYSDDDDSEEDWRPSASSKNGKKQKQKFVSGASTKRGRKRKNSSAIYNKNLKRKSTNGDNEYDELNEASEDDYDYDDFDAISKSPSNKPAGLLQKKFFSDKNSSTSSNDYIEDTFNLLVYVKDLADSDLHKINSLCLWRKDNNNLLQKYIRVKTSPEQFLFTSSSVYSSFDDKCISDFYEIKVKSIDTTNRRVKIINPSQLQNLSFKATKNKINSDDDTLSDEKSDVDDNKHIFVKSEENCKKPVPKSEEDPYDDDEEVEEENDEEEDDCNLEGDDDDDIEEYDDMDG